MRAATLLLIAALSTAACGGSEPPEEPEDPVAALERFFEEFTGEWVRANPDQAIATRYFEGATQRELERQLTPRTRAWQLERVALARRGLEELSAFDLEAVPTRSASPRR